MYISVFVCFFLSFFLCLLFTQLWVTTVVYTTLGHDSSALLRTQVVYTAENPMLMSRDNGAGVEAARNSAFSDFVYSDTQGAQRLTSVGMQI